MIDRAIIIMDIRNVFPKGLINMKGTDEQFFGAPENGPKIEIKD